MGVCFHMANYCSKSEKLVFTDIKYYFILSESFFYSQNADAAMT